MASGLWTCDSISVWCYKLLLLSCFSRVRLCDPIDGSSPGSPVPGILQARTLEWVAISFSNAWKWKVKVKSLSRVQPLATPWTAAFQAPPSMGFSRQEYWSGMPLPFPYTLLLVCIVCYSSPRELIQWCKLMLLPVLAPARPPQVTEHLFPSLFRIKN